MEAWKKKGNKTYGGRISVERESKQCNRLRVVPHFSLEIVERAKRERAWKSPHVRKARSDFLARSRFLALLSLGKNGDYS